MLQLNGLYLYNKNSLGRSVWRADLDPLIYWSNWENFGYVKPHIVRGIDSHDGDTCMSNKIDLCRQLVHFTLLCVIIFKLVC